MVDMNRIDEEIQRMAERIARPTLIRRRPGGDARTDEELVDSFHNDLDEICERNAERADRDLLSRTSKPLVLPKPRKKPSIWIGILSISVGAGIGWLLLWLLLKIFFS